MRGRSERGKQPEDKEGGEHDSFATNPVREQAVEERRNTIRNEIRRSL